MVSDILAYLAVAAIPVAVAGTMGYLIAVQTLFYRLRLWHPDYYEAIGRPSLFVNNTISRSRKFGRYVMERDYIEVPDDRIVRLGDLARRLGEAGIVACIAIPVLMFFALALP